MPRKPPAVRDFMSRLPVEIESYDSVSRAVDLMREMSIHHIPVMSGASLLGILTARDLLEAKLEHGDSYLDLEASQLCVRDVVKIGPQASITDAAEAMLRHKVGSTLVVDGTVVVGIVTKSDALRALGHAYGKEFLSASPSS